MRRAGFTVVELFVVLSVTALLMALLLPSLQNSREQAKTVLCSSNVKQLVLGLVTYEAEYETFPCAFDKLIPGPPPGGYPGYGQYDKVGWWWFNFIEGFYTKSDSRRTVVRCPSKRLSNPKLKNNILCGNYGVNRSICKSSDDIPSRREEFVGTPLCSSDIPSPSRTMLIVDSGYSIISWWHATNIPPVALDSRIIEDTAYIPGLRINRERDLWPGQEEDAIGGRHPNKTVNVGFMDDHVDKVEAESLFVEKTADGYKNKNPLWQPK